MIAVAPAAAKFAEIWRDQNETICKQERFSKAPSIGEPPQNRIFFQHFTTAKFEPRHTLSTETQTRLVSSTSFSVIHTHKKHKSVRQDDWEKTVIPILLSVVWHRHPTRNVQRRFRREREFEWVSAAPLGFSASPHTDTLKLTRSSWHAQDETHQHKNHYSTTQQSFQDNIAITVAICSNHSMAIQQHLFKQCSCANMIWQNSWMFKAQSFHECLHNCIVK